MKPNEDVCSILFSFEQYQIPFQGQHSTMYKSYLELASFVFYIKLMTIGYQTQFIKNVYRLSKYIHH